MNFWSITIYYSKFECENFFEYFFKYKWLLLYFYILLIFLYQNEFYDFFFNFTQLHIFYLIILLLFSFLINLILFSSKPCTTSPRGSLTTDEICYLIFYLRLCHTDCVLSLIAHLITNINIFRYWCRCGWVFQFEFAIYIYLHIHVCTYVHTSALSVPSGFVGSVIRLIGVTNALEQGEALPELSWVELSWCQVKSQ